MSCTYRLGNRDDLHAVKRQTADRPDDGVHLLLNVDGDRNDAAAVFTNSNTSEETMKSTMKTNIPTMRWTMTVMMWWIISTKRITINSFNAGDVILRLWSRNCFTAGLVIYHNNRVPYGLTQHKDRVNVMKVSTEWDKKYFWKNMH